MDFSNIVRFHRKKAGLSQAELARIAGVGKTAVFDIEKGKQSVRYVTLSQVLVALNVKLLWTSPLKELYDREDEKSEGPSA